MIAAALALVLAAAADDAEIARILRESGSKVTETKGVVTTVEVGDCSAWKDDDFKRVAQLSHLRSLSFGPGLGDAALPLLAGLSDLESVSTNLSQISDEGVKGFADFKRLKVLKFFHPAKTFTGAGLAALAELPALESLTVAGSLAFDDSGMAAVGKLVRLREFRSWHAGQTIEGVRKLQALPKLQSLTLGQRLAYKPPTTLSDETLAVLAEMKSLETLQLEEARLTLEALSRLKQLPALKKLVLNGVDIAETDIVKLRAELPQVTIQFTPPNDVYMKRIVALFGPAK